MNNKKIILTADQCDEFLNQELLIGSDETKDGKRKRFTYNPSECEYKIWIDKKQLDYGEGIEYGMDLENLLDVYNEL